MKLKLATEPQRRGVTEMDFNNQLTEKIIGAAIEVYRQLGPGLLESTYERELCIELELAKMLVTPRLRASVANK